MHVSSASAIVFAPHQDDETFGCGGLIALKRRLGARVVIVFLTDGQSCRRTLPSAPNLVTIRKQEALSAAKHLGVPFECVHFLDFPDSQLSSLGNSTRDQVIRSLGWLIDKYSPEEIYVPHRHDQLADHEATYALLMDSLRGVISRPAIFQYPIWLTWLTPLWLNLGSDDCRGALSLSIACVLDRKRLAIQAYQSQLERLPEGFLSRFRIPFEVFFPS
jgi:LmbE family N-acetylglucosaminyl deacetylase